MLRPTFRSNSLHIRRLALATLLLMGCAGFRLNAQAQLNDIDRGRARVMLNQAKDDVKKYYYDPGFRGIDIDARFNAANDLIKQATSLGQAFGIIAQTINSLDDSHTYFVPPETTVHADYGFLMQMIGDRCYVIGIKPGSDAEAKGLKPGDMIQRIGVVTPTRNTFEKLRYLFYVLRPQPGLRLFLQKPDGQTSQLDVLAKVRQDKRTLNFAGDDADIDFFNFIRDLETENRLHRHRFDEFGDDLFIWKMPSFDLSDREIDSIMDKVKSRKALILDLRSNGGGAEDTLKRLTGYFFEEDQKIADIKGRKDAKPVVAKGRGSGSYKGKIVVLVDSESGSAAEIFARVMQLQKRAAVIGDHTAGAVMRAKFMFHEMGLDIKVFYGISVTVSDAIMSDGQSLEKLGVVPDELILPTGSDVAAGRDPVLAHAAELLGFKLDAQKAGTLFPLEWKK